MYSSGRRRLPGGRFWKTPEKEEWTHGQVSRPFPARLLMRQRVIVTKHAAEFIDLPELRWYNK